MLYLLYRALGTVLFPLVRLLAPFLQALGGRYGYGIDQRLGRYGAWETAATTKGPVLWIHASSVGEVQAATILIQELLRLALAPRLLLTSTTEQGHRLAKSRLPREVTCLMAPLDMPAPVRQALQAVQPQLYLCLETELWPVMLTQLRQAGVPVLLLNGRLSERSLACYLRISASMRDLVSGLQVVAAISQEDGDRFAALGVPGSRIQVCGNLKHDLPIEDPMAARTLWRKRLGVDQETVFLCGSTHEDEEAQLLPVFQQLRQVLPLVLVLAPRHLERVASVAALLTDAGLAFDRYSSLTAQPRRAEIILVDTMGDLAHLYSAGDYIFCGGSLVPKGGHNIIEAARWGRPVAFGPEMKDFRAAADLLLACGGGFEVADGTALAAWLLDLHHHPLAYQAACTHAAEAATRQRGAVARQAGIVRQILAQGRIDQDGGVLLGSPGAQNGPCGA